MCATHRLEGADRAAIRHSEKASQARGAHHLERVEGGTDQDSKIKRADIHSPPRQWRGGDRSGQQKMRASESTHVLESIEGGTSHDTETKRAGQTHVLESTTKGQVSSKQSERAEIHIPSGEQRAGQVRKAKEASERGTLTIWRTHMEEQVRTGRKASESLSRPGDRKRGDK